MPLNRNWDAKRGGCGRNLSGPEKRLRRAGAREARSGERRAARSDRCPCVLVFQASAGFTLEDAANPGRESPLLIVQTQFLCDGAVRTKNCVWTSVAEISPLPDGCIGAEEEERTFPGLGALQGNLMQPREALRRISRKRNKNPAAAPYNSVLPRCVCGDNFNASNIGRAPTRMGRNWTGMEDPSRGLRYFAGGGGDGTKRGRAPWPCGSVPVYPPGIYF